MRGSSRRRSAKISPVGVKTEPVAPPPGRFTDQLVQCVTCGRTFVFTVEEQRQLADAGLPVVPPEQCPRCAPRVATTEDEGPRTEERPRPQEVHAAPAPAPRPAPPPVRPPLAAAAPVTRREVDEFAGQYTVLSYGHVKLYDEERGVGTIVDEDTHREYRFYHSALEGVKTVTPGQAVEFEVSHRGREVEATHVLPV